jgi:hypothetical protein
MTWLTNLQKILFEECHQQTKAKVVITAVAARKALVGAFKAIALRLRTEKYNTATKESTMARTTIIQFEIAILNIRLTKPRNKNQLNPATRATNQLHLRLGDFRISELGTKKVDRPPPHPRRQRRPM